MVLRSFLAFLILGLTPAPARALTVPSCLDRNGAALPVINEQVVRWKSSTPNQFLARARVAGVLSQVYPDHSGHRHFEIRLGGGPSDTLEVIFNEDFGAVPELHAGMRVEACGDYITSTAGPYPVSPDGAIIHWVHATNRPERHAGGYLMIDGTVYGQDLSKAWIYGDERQP